MLRETSAISPLKQGASWKKENFIVATRLSVENHAQNENEIISSFTGTEELLLNDHHA